LVSLIAGKSQTGPAYRNGSTSRAVDKIWRSVADR
jgi:hypothetical protein